MNKTSYAYQWKKFDIIVFSTVSVSNYKNLFILNNFMNRKNKMHISCMKCYRYYIYKWIIITAWNSEDVVSVSFIKFEYI